MSENQAEKDRKDAVPDPEDRSITGAIPASDDETADGKVPAPHPDDDPDKEGEDRFDAG